ncbi:cyclin-domain-containing protein [Umbelopsis sp. AD052]|nr:cyclin-domain-containing protein [Umbelopsis sp. AD052]
MAPKDTGIIWQSASIMNSSNDIVNATMYDFRAPWGNYAKSTPIEYTYSNAYPCLKALPDVLDGNKSSNFNRQRLGKTPSDTPSLSSSSSSLSSTSPEEDDDAHIRHASQTPIRYTNSLIQKISLVDKLVETTSAVIDAIWWPSIETQNVKVVSTAQFVREILKRSKSTYSTLQAALYYIFRIKQKIMDRMAERNTLSAQQSSPQDCIFCGRRMFLAAVMVASKFLQDKTYRNSAWAKISGLTTSEISYSEMAFLKLIDFRLFISKDTFEMWHRMLSQHISQLMNMLPKSRRLPPASRAALSEMCNYGYQCTTMNSKALDYTHEPYFVNIVKSPDAVAAKRHAYHDPTQHRKKLCQ